MMIREMVDPKNTTAIEDHELLVLIAENRDIMAKGRYF